MSRPMIYDLSLSACLVIGLYVGLYAVMLGMLGMLPAQRRNSFGSP